MRNGFNIRLSTPSLSTVEESGLRRPELSCFSLERFGYLAGEPHNEDAIRPPTRQR